MTETPGSLIDNDRTACLCDVGAPDYVAAVCVTPTGDDVLWLVHRDELGREDAAIGSAVQPHEQLGRLPATWRRRINGDPRCGAQRSNGQPCRMKVASEGDICKIHRTPRCSGCGQTMHYQADTWGCFGCDPDRYWTPQPRDGCVR